MSIEVRVMEDQDRDRLVALYRQAFNTPSSDLKRLQSIPVEDVRVVTENGLPVASLRLLRAGHFFGGASVPAADVCSVQVAPECRSRGYGQLLMKEVLQELRSEGISLSILFPSTPGPYRRAGYEMAGAYVRYSIPLSALPRNRGRDVEAWDNSSLHEVMDCYRRCAMSAQGLLDRPHSWWPGKTLRIAPPEKRPVYRYLVFREGKVTGYVVFTQERADSPIPGSFSLACRDLFWRDAQTARSLLGLAAGHRAQGNDLCWFGPVENPLAFFLAERYPVVQRSRLWMARLIHVRNALEARGYPPRLETAVQFTVVDRVLPCNSRAYRLRVSGGRGSAVVVDRARVQVDAAALAAVYTGWLPAREAVRAGAIANASRQDVETLEAVFGGAKPWLGDHF